VARAKLINFMVNFTKNPSLVISYSVVFNGLVSEVFFKPIYDLYSLKVKDNTTASATWNVTDFISLQSDLNLMELGNEGHHKMKSWLGPRIEHCTSSFIHSNISRVDDMKSTCPIQSSNG
jgi:hypothetical protein